MSSLLLRNGLVVRRLRGSFAAERADILIRGSYISSLEPACSVPPGHADEMIDASRLLVMPGMINGHVHSWDHYIKGCIENLTTEVAMSMIRPRRPVRLTARQVYLRTMIGAIESLRTGATTIVDDLSFGQLFSRDHADSALQAYHDSGTRALVGFSMIDKPVVDSYPFAEESFPTNLLAHLRALPRPSSEQLIALCRDLAVTHHPDEHRVGLIVSPSAPHRCTDTFLRTCRDLADEFHLPLMTHCQETRLQIITGTEFYGKSLIAHLDEIGFLKSSTSLIHAVWLSRNDIDLVARSGASIQYNPWSNVVMGAGIAPVRACLDAGVNVSIGTDGTGCLFGVNMLNAVGYAATLPKIANPDMSAWITAAEVFHAATEGGAKALGQTESLGRIEPGFKADIVLYSLDASTLTPLNDPVRQIVYGERGAAITTVIVDGAVVMRDGRLTAIDEVALLREAQEIHAELSDDLSVSLEDAAPFTKALTDIYVRSLACPIAADYYAAWLTGNNIAPMNPQ